MKRFFLFGLIVFSCTGSIAQWSTSGNTLSSGNYLGSLNDFDIVFKRNTFKAGFLGTSNTAFGLSSLNSVSSGINNCAFGLNALAANLGGSSNTGIGVNALINNSAGNGNTAIGQSSLFNNIDADYNTAVGYGALANTNGTTADYNVAVGANTLYYNTSGTFNTAVGSGALQANSTGSYNTATGYALNSNNNGHHNTANGFYSLFSNTTGANNTGVGTNSLYKNSSGANNVGIGFGALNNGLTGSYNTATGNVSMYFHLSGDGNSAYGNQALYNDNYGVGNSAVGNSALYANISGSYNSSIGYESGKDISSGTNNIFVGYRAGYGITSGSDNTIIGSSVAALGITGGSGNTIIGAKVTGLGSGLNNTIILADGAGNKRLYIDQNGKAGFGTSTPNTTVEINSGTSSVSGLRFTNLTSSSTQSSSNGLALSVDASGNVILVPDLTGGSGTGTVYINAGPGISVGGAGTLLSPYNITNTSGASLWTTTGAGTNNIINANSGAVVIGTGITSWPGGYKLYVSDGILAEKVRVAVKNTSSWADYVFSKEYNLMPINEVETFIKANKHLPGVPSAEKLVKEGGIDVNEMFAKQMEKIEEMTLYIIELKKELNELKAQHATLQSTFIHFKK